MDVGAAIAKLQDCRRLIDDLDAIAVRAADRDPYWDSPEWIETERAIRSALPGCERLAGAVDPVAADIIKRNEPKSYAGSFDSAGEGIDRAIGALSSRDEIDAILGPGPHLAATHLHRWVWEPASTRWDAGQRRDAIQAAATSVFDMHLPAKLRRRPDTKGGTELASAFSTKGPRAREPTAPPTWLRAR